MGFERLKFTREWTNAEDFPTVETDEVQVRADMQALHDENKNGLNRLMDALEAAVGAAKLGAVDPEGKESTVQQELSALYEGMIKAGALPVGGNADQMLVKSSGENYETKWAGIAEIVEPVRGVAGGVASLSEEGRIPAAQMPEYLQRTSLLGADTAAKFGLGSEAVLDDAFAAAKSMIDAVNANAETKAKIATGNYTGTGTYGSANPNSLTFEFEPKIVFVVGFNHDNTASYAPMFLPLIRGYNFAVSLIGDQFEYTSPRNADAAGLNVTWDTKSVSWYQKDSNQCQFNYSGVTYHYVAFG